MVYHWEHLTHKEFLALKAKKPWVILPIGSIEQHGPHLPVGTDSLILAGSIKAAEPKLKGDTPFIILPALMYGKSVEHTLFAGTVTLSAQTLLSQLNDIVASLARHDFNNIIIVNSHGGNTGILDGYLQDLRQIYQVNVFAIHLFNMYTDVKESIFHFPHSFHADALETSLIWYWYPDLVKKEDIPQESTRTGGFETLKKLNGKASWGWATPEVTQNGVIGSPQFASPESGKMLAEHVGTALSETIMLIVKA
jgi:creatinine amidohydrolase